MRLTIRFPRSLGDALRRAGLALLLVLLSVPSHAAVDDILDAIRQSEFRFARGGSEVPFVPVGWLQYRHYPATGFRDDRGLLPPAEATEHTLSLGAVVPVHVEQRDMILLGADLARDSIKVQSGPYRDQRVARITPVAAWLHQFGTDHTLGAFIAPVISKEYEQDRPWSVNGFAGLIGMYWYSNTLQWVYGGVYESYFGERRLYPYLGLQWNPTPQWSLALLFPWPTITYSPAKRWLVQLGISPGGSSWSAHDSGYESTHAFGSWNTTFGVGYQLHGSWWLYAGAGRTGFRGATLTTSGTERNLDADRSPVYTIAIQFRP
jgi:hypothetical protein